MSEFVDFVPEKWHITLVSGLGNDTAKVAEPHEQLADAWREQGLHVVTVHPDYDEGDLDTSMKAIRQVREDALQQGLNVLSVGSSAGGTLTSLERVVFALNQGEVGQPLSDRGVTICSRSDLLNHPRKYGVRYPTARAIRDRSPLLAEAAETLRDNLDLELVRFTPANTLSFTAGEFDERIPPESSVLPGARTVRLLLSSSGKPLTHDTAVGTVLRTPRHRDKILSIAGYKPVNNGHH